MPDLIQLLPEIVSNQIAAGEVVQRPASVVKELLENAVDADATNIHLIVIDGGRTLIQVIDNGKGMSPKDASLCFSRHATSKLRTAEDLVKIKTKGFRGEALSSIASIAQVSLKSKQSDDEVGIAIEIEGNQILSEIPCSWDKGTSIAVKNLFYNVPARRAFIKSDTVEFRHIIDEFERVSIAHPDISFVLEHNGNKTYNLTKGNLKQRIIGIFGNSYQEKLIPVETATSLANIHGYIGKPQFAKKTRGEQFFFLNKRYIKSNYLNYAVQNSYKDLLPKENFPSYFIFFEIDPSLVDINIHPTKTEVKFEDEKAIFAILNSAIKQSLGKFNLTPTLDFNQDPFFQQIPAGTTKSFIPVPSIQVNPHFNPFEGEKKYKGNNYTTFQKESWIEMYADIKNLTPNHPPQKAASDLFQEDELKFQEETRVFQLHKKYILSQVKSGLLLIDQHEAHQRIIYEHLKKRSNSGKNPIQQVLFPTIVEFNLQDSILLTELLPTLLSLGFEVKKQQTTTFSICGIPADLPEIEGKEAIEHILEVFKNTESSAEIEERSAIMQALAKKMAIKYGQILSVEEMRNLIDGLFACETPNNSPNGKTIVTLLNFESIEQLFSMKQ